jgi:hypothetical protein
MKFTQKKTEILQVRVPHGLKREFMERCRLENRVASDVVRDFLESFLARPAEILRSEKAVMIRKRFIYPTLAAAGLVGAVVVTLPTAGQARSLQQAFAAADANHDGVLSDREWEAASVGNPEAPLTVIEGPKVGVLVGASSPAVLDTPTARSDDAKFGAHLVAVSDHNGDGKVSFEEYRIFRVVQAASLFARADVNADGQMTKEEFVSATLPAPMLRGKPNGHPVWTVKRDLEAYFDGMEKKNDGFVTREEYVPV